jgi:hypothetical protein
MPAQHEIATDWIAAYKKYIGPSPISGHRLASENPLRCPIHPTAKSSGLSRPNPVRFKNCRPLLRDGSSSNFVFESRSV